MEARSAGLVLPLCAAILLAGCTQTGTQTGTQPRTTAGNVITIDDCKAEPFILEVAEGTEVTFRNADAAAHSITIDGQEVPLPAEGSAKVVAKRQANAPSDIDYTNNYLCDGASSGAMYIPAGK